jgi:hypothetical protein
VRSKCLLQCFCYSASLGTKHPLGSKILSQVRIKQNDSHFWRGLLNVKDEFLSCVSFNMKDGSQIRFWRMHGVDRDLSGIFTPTYTMYAMNHIIQWLKLWETRLITFLSGVL